MSNDVSNDVRNTMMGERLDALDRAVRNYLAASTDMDLRRTERAVVTMAVELSATRTVLGEESLA